MGTDRVGSELPLGYLWVSSGIRAVPSYLYQYPRGSHASRATIITERDGGQLLALVEIPIQLGMALVTRDAYGCLPLFD